MKSSILNQACVFVVALGVSTATVGTAIGQPTTKKLRSAPAQVKIATAKADPPLSFYEGAIGDHVELLSRSAGLNSKTAHVGDLGLCLDLAQSFYLFRPQLENRIRGYFANKGLYDIKVNLGLSPDGRVDGKGIPLIMSLDPKTKTIRIDYRLFDSTMSGKVSRDFWFDPTLKAKFTVNVRMIFTTTGTNLDPLVLKSSLVTFSDYRPDSDLRGKTTDFTTRTINDEGFGKHFTSAINNKLRPITVTRGLPVVTPGVRFVPGQPIGPAGARAILEFAPASNVAPPLDGIALKKATK